MSTMPTFDVTKPDGSVQTGAQVPASANANDGSLWYQAVTGQVQGWAFSAVTGTGTAEQPQYFVWSNGVYRVRATNTWGSAGGANGNITGQTWEVSQDSGSTPNSTGTWASMGTAQTYSYDSSGNPTATANAGGFLGWLSYLLGKVKTLLASFNTHTATTGTGVHGLGSMATQSAAGVAVTGGAMDGVVIGASTRANCSATLFRGGSVNLGTLTASQNIDWSAGDYFYGTIGNATALAWTNLPPAGLAQGITLELTNPGAFAITWPAGTKWPSATAPTLTAAGIDLIEFSCRDGSTVRGAGAIKDSR